MKKEDSYESPKLEFEEMKIFEKVADTCWGYNYAWYTAPDGKKYYLNLATTGCSGIHSAQQLNAYIVSLGYVNPNYTANVCNTQNTEFVVVKS